MRVHESPRRAETLLVISHVQHFQNNGVLSAYGPYAREIDMWATLFERTVIAAPCRRQTPPDGDCLAFQNQRVSIQPVVETAGRTRWSKLRQVLLMPWVVLQLLRAIARADAVHVRCPGNLGLLGAVVVPLFRWKPRIAKYAGQWNTSSDERRVVRLQRWLLASKWWGAPVMVYGEWPDQPPHIRPCFTSMMDAEQLQRAIETASQRSVTGPLRVLFCGRLAAEKRVETLLHATRRALDAGVEMQLNLVGDGPLSQDLKSLTQELQLDDAVQFAGSVPFQDVMEWYASADCLVLPSKHSEGWPKVVAEAMCHGTLCVVVDHGHVGAMARGRGVVLSEGSVQEIAEALCWISRNPDDASILSRAGAEWASQYSLPGLADAISSILENDWPHPRRRNVRMTGAFDKAGARI